MVFVVESVHDLSLGNANSQKLFVWTYVIAKGGLVVEEQNSHKTRQYLAAIDLVNAKLHFTDSFRSKQTRIFRAFTSLIQGGRDKKWKSVTTPEKDAHRIDSTNDVRLFLLNVQRVPHDRLRFSSSCKPSKTHKTSKASTTQKTIKSSNMLKR